MSYIYLGILLAGLLGGATGAWQVQNWRHGAQEAAQAREDRARQETREAAQQGAADAIAQIKVVNTTIRGKTETIVRENVVYRDCVNDARVVRNINAALAGRPEPAPEGIMPAAVGAK